MRLLLACFSETSAFSGKPATSPKARSFTYAPSPRLASGGSEALALVWRERVMNLTTCWIRSGFAGSCIARAKCLLALLAGGCFITARVMSRVRRASVELLCRPRLTRGGGSLASIVFEAMSSDLKVLLRHIPGKSLRGFLGRRCSWCWR